MAVKLTIPKKAKLKLLIRASLNGIVRNAETHDDMFPKK
jgi:hypothetical protein